MILLLDIAFRHEEELRNKFMDVWYDDAYKFYYVSPFRGIYSIQNDYSAYARQFVSLDTSGKIIGFIGYDICNESDSAEGLSIINFSDNKILFGFDVAQVINDIFCKFNMRKLEFSVVCGNPIETTYDKMTQKYNGQVEGLLRKHIRLADGQYYDQKLYGIFREDYIKANEEKQIIKYRIEL